jgi:hypothetical protein
MGKLCMHSSCLDFFPFGWGGEVLFWFLLICNVSHQILNGLSSCSQLILHDFVIFINAFPIAPLFIPYDLTNVVLLTPIKRLKTRYSIYSVRNNKVFVSYHCHLRLQWKIHFSGLSKLLILRRFLFCKLMKILLHNKIVSWFPPPPTNWYESHHWF